MEEAVVSEREALATLSNALRERGVGKARIALVLGSGLGAFAERLTDPEVIPYGEIECLPRSAVPGHAGQLVLGQVSGVPVVVQQGRVHLYEGWTAREVTRCVRALGGLGVRGLVLTNAAGGLEADWQVPSLMRITDHLNLQGHTPLLAGEGGYGSPYDVHYGEALELAAEEAGVELKEGVYAALLGPTYETPSEIELLRWAGAQAVGMSTVAEAVTGHQVGMSVAAISCITNHAAGVTGEKLSHDEVVEAGRVAADAFCRLLEAAVPRLAERLD